MPDLLQIRPTIDSLSPLRRAIEARDQCVAGHLLQGGGDDIIDLVGHQARTGNGAASRAGQDRADSKSGLEIPAMTRVFMSRLQNVDASRIYWRGRLADREPCTAPGGSHRPEGAAHREGPGSPRDDRERHDRGPRAVVPGGRPGR
jgi:hypothetical protein